ncbi:MAG: hypothetical protein ACI4KM_01795 [Oscillospiraceae bacterium]
MKKTLYLLAIICQYLTIFPFLIVTEGIGFGEFVWWHYIAFYATIGFFWAFGRICTAWTQSAPFKKTFKPSAVFLGKIAIIVPSIGFIVIMILNRLSTGLLLYMFPACVIMYFGGCRSCGRGYSDVFTTFWFGCYVVGAVAASLLLMASYDKSIGNIGNYQLCIVFGILIIISAVLANQTNIDVRTQQRAGGKAVLPKGLRSYNASIIAGIVAATVGLFLLSGPIAGAVVRFIRMLITMFLNWLREQEGVEVNPNDLLKNDNNGDAIQYVRNDDSLIEILYVIIFVVLIILAIKYRKNIIDYFKTLLKPLFKQDKIESLPFSDEVFEAENERMTERNRRKTEQQLLKQYRRENNPEKRYRLGYLLILLRLEKTSFAQKPSDTTDIHAIKETMAFRNESINQMVRIYEEIRYGGRIPTEQECQLQQRIIDSIGK